MEEKAAGFTKSCIHGNNDGCIILYQTMLISMGQEAPQRETLA